VTTKPFNTIDHFLTGPENFRYFFPTFKEIWREQQETTQN